jgi:hypothetical protein
MDKGEAFAIATKQLKEGEGSLKNWETEPAKWDSVKPGDFIADGPDSHEVTQVISNSRRGLELKRVWTNSKKHPVGEEFFIKHDHTAMKDEKDDNLFKVTNYTKEPNSLSESNMSMDELMQQFVDALDIEDDNEANQIIKNIGIAIKNKVKTGASNLYQKARTGLAKQYDADLNE